MSHTASDALLINRIIAMRESVRRNKQKAIEIWNACIPAIDDSSERESVGKFTQQLVKA